MEGVQVIFSLCICSTWQMQESVTACRASSLWTGTADWAHQNGRGKGVRIRIEAKEKENGKPKSQLICKPQRPAKTNCLIKVPVGCHLRTGRANLERHKPLPRTGSSCAARDTPFSIRTVVLQTRASVEYQGGARPCSTSWQVCAVTHVFSL